MSSCATLPEAVSPLGIPYYLYKAHVLVAYVIRQASQKWLYQKMLEELRAAVNSASYRSELVPYTRQAVAEVVSKYGLAADEYIELALPFYRERPSYLVYWQMPKLIATCEKAKDRNWTTGLSVPNTLRDPFYCRDPGDTVIAVIPPEQQLAHKPLDEQLDILDQLYIRVLSSLSEDRAMEICRSRNQQRLTRLQEVFNGIVPRRRHTAKFSANHVVDLSGVVNDFRMINVWNTRLPDSGSDEEEENDVTTNS